MNDFFGIHFAGASNAIYLPVVLLCMFFLLRHHRALTLAVGRLVHPLNQKMLLPHYSLLRRRVKTTLWIASLLAIFVMMLQPQWGSNERVVPQEGRDLVVLLDISRSMLAADMRPNRLEFTKLKLRNLLSKLTFERVGLILFSGSAFVQCPLTADYQAFLSFLEQVDVETIASGTTSIDAALAKAIDLFAAAKGRKNKLVLLATDGEDFSLNLEHIRERARSEGLTLFALGVGTGEGAPVPKIDRQGKMVGHETDEKGGIALSRLNEPLLKKIAESLGGFYVKATYQDSDLDRIVQAVSQFEKEKFADTKVSRYEDRYAWWAGAAFLMLLLEWIL